MHISLLALVPWLLAPAVQSQSTWHVLIVANNQDPTGELSMLRYADDDGARYAELFSSAGARVELLTTMDADSQKLFPQWVGQSRPPTHDRLSAALNHVFENIRQDRAEGRAAEFVFVFTGHGRVGTEGVGEILLADGPFNRNDLFSQVIDASPADYNHIIIDACHAYFMVMGRGAWKDDQGNPKVTSALQAYLDSPERLLRRATTGVILSTAGTAEVHEWERLRSGIFSHELRSGLLGLADINGDGRITYEEIEAFLSAANAGVTNAKAKIQVFARPPQQDLAHPLFEMKKNGFVPLLRFDAQVAGHFQIEDARGISYAEWNKAPDHPAYLALLYTPVQDRPEYFIRRGDQELVVNLLPPGSDQIDFVFTEEKMVASTMTSRGSVAESFRKELFSVPFGSAFLQGFAVNRQEQPAEEVAQSLPGNTSSTQHLLALGYNINGAALPSTGIAQGVMLSYRLMPWKVVNLAFRAGWSHFLDSSNLGVEEIALMVGPGFKIPIVDWLQVELSLNVGNYFVATQRDSSSSGQGPGSGGRTTTSWDALNPAVSLLGGVRIFFTDLFWLQASGGVIARFSVGDGNDTKWLPDGLLELGAAF